MPPTASPAHIEAGLRALLRTRADYATRRWPSRFGEPIADYALLAGGELAPGRGMQADPGAMPGFSGVAWLVARDGRR